VTVSGVDTAAGSCGGRSLLVTLHTTAKIDHRETTTVPPTGSSVTLGFPDADPGSVVGVSVTLAG
jgi:hypothetical protein